MQTSVILFLFCVSAFAQMPDILRKRCVACHGPGMQQSGFRLDDGDAALKGGYNGAAIMPGDAAASKLIARVTSAKEGFMMPPVGNRLSDAEIQTLRQWIDQGAKFPASLAKSQIKVKGADHWAYQPVKRGTLPEVKAGGWVRNPIDAFVLAKLEANQFTPSPEAPKTTLIRRLSLDLRGLPPTPAEVAAFLVDNSPEAYERAVDSMLRSPHYGERWARPWLDVARYADSDGFEKDLVRPWAWRWRNYVIDSLNADKPFDQFTIEQIAGDLLPDATVEQRVATGFHRNALVNREGGVNRDEDRFEQTINRTNTLSTAWLGLTTGCAQCHDHKYDAVSQKEYYQLFAFMSRTADEDIDAPMAGEMGAWMQAHPGYVAKRAALLKEYGIAALQPEWEKNMRVAIETPGKANEWDFALTSCRAMLDNAAKMIMTPPENRSGKVARRVTDYFVYNAGPDYARNKEVIAKLKELREKLNALNAETPKLTQAYTLMENPQARPVRLAVRGDFKQPGIEVQPGTLAVLPKLDGGSAPARLAFARWLVSSENPLTPRVTMNRSWQEFFGRGIVRTSEDFGTQGEKPTHPELLDYLAGEFVARNWSMKQMHKLIVMSATYRQSSNARPDVAQRDPDNSLLARQVRLRLSAEAIRDSALSVSGLIDTRIGGPSVRPPLPAGVAELGYANSVKWKESTGADKYRRGVYVHFQRTTPHPQLMNFDMPEGTVSCARRRLSNSPLQSLNLLNDPVFVEAAQAMALRILQEGPRSSGERLDRAFEIALARKPSPAERTRLLKYLDQQMSIFATDTDGAAKLMPLHLEGATRAESASLVGLSRVLMNLDEFITRE